jgi:leucyl-tRNA synthetase
MGVPAHDERDYNIAIKYSIPVKEVIRPSNGDKAELPFVDKGVLVNCGELDGLSSAEAIVKLEEKATKGKFGSRQDLYRLKDWLISRQRYWGAPIPLIHCKKFSPSLFFLFQMIDFFFVFLFFFWCRCGVVEVPEKDLPVELPMGIKLASKGGSPLANQANWVETTCPCCGGKARRETDTMDTFVDSSWYFLRFLDARNPHRYSLQCENPTLKY